jgi:hypothetical protein
LSQAAALTPTFASPHQYRYQHSETLKSDKNVLVFVDAASLQDLCNTLRNIATDHFQGAGFLLLIIYHHCTPRTLS